MFGLEGRWEKGKEKTFLLFGFNKFGEIILNKEKSSLENLKGKGGQKGGNKTCKYTSQLMYVFDYE